jgi:hypothetical protein
MSGLDSLAANWRVISNVEMYCTYYIYWLMDCQFTKDQLCSLIRPNSIPSHRLFLRGTKEGIFSVFLCEDRPDGPSGIGWRKWFSDFGVAI